MELASPFRFDLDAESARHPMRIPVVCCSRWIVRRLSVRPSWSATSGCEGLFGLARSGAAEQIAGIVRASAVIANDETSARVKGKAHWAFGYATRLSCDSADARQVRARRTFSPVCGRRFLSDRLPAQCTHAARCTQCIGVALTASWIAFWTSSRPMSRAATCGRPLPRRRSDQ
jgi:hypothetical protein